MLAVKTILLPTDGSACSQQALTYALPFAQQFGARLVALHVIDQRWEEHLRQALAQAGQEIAPKLQHAHAEEAQRILREVADAAAKTGVAVETRVVTGLPSEDIVRLRKELPADLIILGTHGRTGLSHALLGSVAEEVVRRAPCPVLTVRLAEGESVPA